MYPWSFLCEQAKNKQSQRKNFVKSVRKQYGNPDSHAFYFVLIVILKKLRLLAKNE